MAHPGPASPRPRAHILPCLALSSLSFDTPQCKGFTEFQSFAMELPHASGILTFAD